MRFKELAQLKRPEPTEVTFNTLPQTIQITPYAKQKAFTIGETVAAVFGQNYEWYGYTLADSANPELISDIGLPNNDLNLHDYATLGSARIAEFQEQLPPHRIINGWVHSHGDLDYRRFSTTDEANHRTVLDFVAARTRKPLAKREVMIEGLTLLVKDRFSRADLAKGSVALITDAPVSEVKIMETIYGSFCYCVVVGSGGWHEQVILHQERGALSSRVRVVSQPAQIVEVAGGAGMTPAEINVLQEEVQRKIRPNLNPPVERMERM